MIEQLRKVLGNAEAVLFDFDGPICSVFAGYPAPQVAEQLRADLVALRPGISWSAAGRSDDPMRVLIDTPTWGAEFAAVADNRLTELEAIAAATARPTEGSEASLRACRKSGRAVAVVSNNSARAVLAYLGKHQLLDLVDGPVVGRRHGRPELMKPHPAPIEDALQQLDLRPPAVVLVGDTPTDVIAARAAGIACIGYANKPGKSELLADAEVVIEDMCLLAEQLRDVPRPR